MSTTTAAITTDAISTDTAPTEVPTAGPTGNDAGSSTDAARGAAAADPTTLAPAAAPEADPVQDLAGRIFTEGVAAFHVGTLHVGVALGLFDTLADAGPCTAHDLASRTGLDAWYVREWLQAETIAGLVRADGPDLTTARFDLAPGVVEVLVDETGPAYLGGLPRAVAAGYSVLPTLLAAFRTGAGVPYEAYGPDAVSGQAALNRPAFIHELTEQWLPAIPEVATRLADPAHPARVADVGCGSGWAAIQLARAHPHVRIDGFDTDEASITAARHNAAEAQVSDRVRFDVLDAACGYGRGRYDLVLFFECVHDMAHPVEALVAAREALAPGGTVIVMDERVSDAPEVGDPVQLFFATSSVLWCLPQGRVDPDSQAVGTMMTTARFRELAKVAGWGDVEVLGIDHPFWRFYRLVA